MALSKVKDEEGKKIFEDEIANIKTDMDKYLKKIRKLEKPVKQCETDLYGLPDKEIKENLKLSKGRKPPPGNKELVDLHKQDTGKMVKEDKTVK
jgi:hypothetical protein